MHIITLEAPITIPKDGSTGIGISYGYAWLLSKRWNLSVEAGLGIYYIRDTKRAHYVGEFDDEYIRRYRRWNMLLHRNAK